MIVPLKSDYEVSDNACKQATGKTITEWFALIEGRGGAGTGRRETINWLYDQMTIRKDVWWPTTIWVECERTQGVVNKKDGLLEGYNICVTKTVGAPVDAVYESMASGGDAWLDNPLTAAEGQSFTDEAGNTGAWVRLRPGKDTRMTWHTKGAENPTQVDVTVTDKGKGKTGIMLLHQRIQTRDEADGLREAWGKAFDRLKATLEG